VAGCSAIVYATCLTWSGNLGPWSAFESSRDVKHLMDFPASHLQTDFGLDGAIAIGVNQQACTALLGSLRLAHGLLATEPGFDKVFCLTADRFPDGAIYEQSYNLISDGGAGWVMSREPRGFRYLGGHHITNGALVMASDDESVGTYFNYTHRLIHQALARTGLAMSEIAWIVPQNMNVKAWQILARLLKIDFERVFFDPLPRCAHVISGDPVINLLHLDRAGKLARGDKLLMVMAGYGMNWQCAVVEKV
jgi:3-oxoacyl-[acyl-carrier-protein] synthase-3